MANRINMPSTIYVVELQSYVVLTSFDISKDGCVFPSYRFDRQHQAAYVACEDIAIKQDKKVVDMVAFSPSSPRIYDPVKTRKQNFGVAKNILSLEADYIDREKRAFAAEKEDAVGKLKHIIA